MNSLHSSTGSSSASAISKVDLAFCGSSTKFGCWIATTDADDNGSNVSLDIACRFIVANSSRGICINTVRIISIIRIIFPWRSVHGETHWYRCVCAAPIFRPTQQPTRAQTIAIVTPDTVTHNTHADVLDAFEQQQSRAPFHGFVIIIIIAISKILYYQFHAPVIGTI